MAQRVGPTGLLISNDDDVAISGGGNPNQTGAPINSPFAGITPQLSGGAAGTQQMNYGQALANAGKQYAFNPKYAAMDQALQRAIANAGFDRTNAVNSLNSGFQSNTQEAQRQNQLAQKALQQRMASQGLGFSGINVEATGELTGDFNRYIDSLNKQYTGGVAGIENAYGRTMGDIAAQRESLWGQQAEDERIEQQRVAREQAEAARQERMAQQQAQLVQQQIAAQQAALERSMQAMAQQRSMPQANGIGAGGGGGPNLSAWGFGGNDTAADQQAQINLLPMDMLTSLYALPGVPEPLKVMIRGRISQMSTPGNPAYSPAPNTWAPGSGGMFW